VCSQKSVDSLYNHIHRHRFQINLQEFSVFVGRVGTDQTNMIEFLEKDQIGS